MKTEVHILCFDEADILPYVLRHYKTFATRIVIHDAGSTDGSRVIATQQQVEIRDWDTSGCLDDLSAMELKNTCWKGTDADWVIVVDCDEFVYFPDGADFTLGRYSKIGAAVIKPHGFDMYSENYPTTSGQIYDEVKMGTASDKWYSKPILFNPRLVEDTGFGIGAHESNPVLYSGQRLTVGSGWPKANPPTYLLHFHHGIGPADRVARRLDAKRLRLSKENVAHHWGNFDPGAKHVADKREFILAGLEQVIP